MNLQGRKREILLGAILVAVLFWAFRPSAPQPAIQEERKGEKKGGAPSFPAIWQMVPDVDFTSLTAQAGEYQGGGRNLFDFGVIKPPPPSPEELARQAAAEQERQRREAEAQPEAQRLREEAMKRQQEEEAARQAAEQARLAANPPPPPKPTPPPINLKFIGVVGPQDGKIAIFLDGSDFVLAKEGETVKGAFRVEKIGYDVLKMGYVDPKFAKEHQILPLGG